MSDQTYSRIASFCCAVSIDLFFVLLVLNWQLAAAFWAGATLSAFGVMAYHLAFTTHEIEK